MCDVHVDMCILLQPAVGSNAGSKDTEMKLNLSESEVQQTVESAPPHAESQTSALETNALVNIPLYLVLD